MSDSHANSRAYQNLKQGLVRQPVMQRVMIDLRVSQLRWIPTPRFGSSQSVGCKCRFCPIFRAIRFLSVMGNKCSSFGPIVPDVLPWSLGFLSVGLTDWILRFYRLLLVLYPCAVFAGSLEPFAHRRLTLRLPMGQR